MGLVAPQAAGAGTRGCAGAKKATDRPRSSRSPTLKNKTVACRSEEEDAADSDAVLLWRWRR